MAAPALHIDAIQTVMPSEVTDPVRRRRIHAAAPIRPESLQNRLYFIMYYQKGEQSALDVAAWIKETLNAALPSRPALAGRLRKENDGGWEIKCNDAGARLVQASVPELSLPEFLKNEESREELEGHLVYWPEIDHNHHYSSALFNVQVTQFKEDGYSIGISCSLLLADPLSLTQFLKHWLQIHTQMVAQSKLAGPSMFHLSHFQMPGEPRRLRSVQLESSSNASTTVLFKLARTPSAAPDGLALAAACFEEAARRLERKRVTVAATFTVLIDDRSDDLKAEKGNVAQASRFGDALRAVGWEELGLKDLAFERGNKPICVSCQIVSSEELVLTMMPSEEEDGNNDSNMQLITVILIK